MIIVYKSNTGHTKKYAELLGKKLNCDIYPINKRIKTTDEVIYMGWVMANKIMGLNKAKEKYNLKIVCAVGMNKKSIDNTKLLCSENNLDNVFYLQGGVDYTKLRGIKKMMFKMVGNQIIKENKKENKDIIPIFKNGGNFIKEENLNEIIDYINK